jgi:cleavage and polyadenylation specificity factor subunit 1
LSLAQIVPQGDEASDEEPKIVAASVAEPFILLVRDDQSIALLRVDESGEIEEVSKPDSLNTIAWQSGALYDDAEDAFHLPLEIEGAEEEDVGTVLMFLLGCDGSLHVRRRFASKRPC